MSRKTGTRAVALSKEDYESWKRTEAVLKDPEAMKMVRASEKAIREGRVTPLDDFMREYRAKHKAKS